MTLSLPRRLIAAGAVCVLALVALVVIEGRARAAGREVILAMEPIDPRSVLSGHYVILNFTEPLMPGAQCPPIDVALGAPGWVALSPRGDRYGVSGAAKTRAAAEKLGAIVVRGDASCEERIPPSGDAQGFPGALRLHLGVDRFHTSQREAEAIEKAMRDHTTGEPRVLAILSIGADGTPRTKGLVVDGKRIELGWF